MPHRTSGAVTNHTKKRKQQTEKTEMRPRCINMVQVSCIGDLTMAKAMAKTSKD
jgi:hypothetical protein